MKTAIISFTEAGYKLAGEIAEILRQEGHRVAIDVKCQGIAGSIACPVTEWAGRQFREQDAIVFIGAAGIAVRAIAPHIQSKLVDPAVVVLDEKGNYCIPLLSGHIGGGNELALFISERICAVPVITTATDVCGKWAVDVFASKNSLYIENRKKAKRISAAVVAGKRVTICMENNIELAGKIPDCVELKHMENSPAGGTEIQVPPDIMVGIHCYPGQAETLCLIPKAVCLGIGCRKGTKTEAIEAAVKDVLEKEKIWPESMEKVASIELKAKEEGLLAYCKNHGLTYETYSAEELEKAEGDFSGSAFVERVTGTDNVCERSAVRASGGKLLVKKHIYEGITVALAVRKWRVHFE